MNTKKYSTISLILLFVSIVFYSRAFAASETEEALKAQIFDNYGITVQDSNSTYGMGWTEDYLRAMTQVFQDMPESFTAATRMVYISPVEEQYEIKYNGYNEEYGIIQFGSEAFSPSSIYTTQFKKIYNSNPSDTDKINRFKTMLVRGMAYSFIQSKTDAYGRSDLIQAYQSIYADNASFSTKLYTLGNENYMVVAPGKNHLWTDLAFAVAQYCTNASGLKSNYPKRYAFVKEYIFDDCGVDGWPEKYLDGTGSTSGGDGHTGGYNGSDTVTSTQTTSGTNTQTQTDTQSQTDTQTDTSSDTDSDTNSDTDTDTDTGSSTSSDTDTGSSTNTDTGTATDIDFLDDRTDIPSIPDGKYYPVVSQVDVGSIGLDSSKMSMPEGMKKAIKELFEQLPKYFTTCTLGISYMPTKDTCDAFSSEGYIFVTNNSWFAPSFVDLDDETRAKRFKQILVREMTNCFLYYHQSQISRWRGTFGREITEDEAKTDIIESAVLYYTDDNYLESLEALKWSFIKTNIFSNGNTPVDTGTSTGSDTGSDTSSSTSSDTDTDTGSDTGVDTGSDTGSDTDTGSATNTGTNTDTGDDGYWRIKLTIINDTNSDLQIGKYDNTSQTQWSHAGFIVYGDYKPGGPGYMRFKGCYDGEDPVITIPAGKSFTGPFTFYGNKEESDNREARYRELFDNYPFSTLEQRTVNGKANYKMNNFIYKPDGSSYSGDKDLTGNLTHGNSYTITYNGGPDNAGSN